MYSFAQRTDTHVIDEPLYAHYLLRTNTQHPGAAEVLKAQKHNGKEVMNDILNQDFGKPLIFLKQMAHHLIDLDFSMLQKMDNVLLIRNPKEVIFSFAKIIQQPTMADIGIKRQYEIYQELIKLGQNPCIIDSKEILQNPSKILQELCRHTAINFSPKMLKWPAQARPEDGVWAKYWYHNVHQSTGFKKYQAKSIELPKNLAAVYKESKPYYDFLYEQCLK